MPPTALRAGPPTGEQSGPGDPDPDRPPSAPGIRAALTRRGLATVMAAGVFAPALLKAQVASYAAADLAHARALRDAALADRVLDTGQQLHTFKLDTGFVRCGRFLHCSGRQW